MKPRESLGPIIRSGIIAIAFAGGSLAHSQQLPPPVTDRDTYIFNPGHEQGHENMQRWMALRSVYRKLHGELQHQRHSSRQNPGLERKLAALDNADIALITEANTEFPYQERAIAILENACAYFKQTPFEDLDALFLARAQQSADATEMEDTEEYFINVFQWLSPSARRHVEEELQALDSFSRSMTIKADYMAMAREDPELVKNDFRKLCERLPAVVNEIRRKRDPDDFGTSITLD